MKRRLLITLKDRTHADELLKYGHIISISDYISNIGFECEDHLIPLLRQHPNIDEIKDTTMMELGIRAFSKQNNPTVTIPLTDTKVGHKIITEI